MLDLFADPNSVMKINEEIDFILQNKTIPRKLRFILGVNEVSNGYSQFVPFFWHIEKTGAKLIQQICNQKYELKPSFILRTKKEIDIFHHRLSGLSATAQEYWDAEKQCKAYAKKLKDASAIGANIKSWTYKQIEGCIPKKAMILPEHKCLPTCFNYLQTPEIYESAKLFTMTNKKARVATVLREPVDRFISMFIYLKTATWDENFNPTQSTINDFIESGEYKSVEWGGNWMVCKLANCLNSNTNAASDIKLKVAKNVIRNILVGFTDNIEEFLERLEIYWQIPSKTREHRKEFLKNFSTKSEQNDTTTTAISEETRTILQKHLSYDIQLYKYAKDILWDEQIQWLVDT